MEKKIIDKTTLGICVAIAVLILAVVFGITSSIGKAVDAARAAYPVAISEAAEQVEGEFYNKGYDEGFTKNEVTNRAAISLDSLQMTSRLEVLEVHDVVFDIEKAEDNKDGIESWLEIPGKGVFTVDMRAAEFIIDENRGYVLVRIPKPEFTELTLEKAEQLLCKNKGANDSIKDGTDIIDEQIKNGYIEIKNSFASNPIYFDSAKKSTVTMITNLVKALNPEVPGLTVEVEFMD